MSDPFNNLSHIVSKFNYINNKGSYQLVYKEEKGAGMTGRAIEKGEGTRKGWGGDWTT